MSNYCMACAVRATPADGPFDGGPHTCGEAKDTPKRRLDMTNAKWADEAAKPRTMSVKLAEVEIEEMAHFSISLAGMRQLRAILKAVRAGGRTDLVESLAACDTQAEVMAMLGSEDGWYD